MNVESKRFKLKSDGFGGVTVRDRDAPYHSHTVPASRLPAVETLAHMTESQFDSAVAAVVYGDRP